ncbi:hypothetical protein BOTCAL_0184g00210 [Botryotinia calthae]|uniref:Uncharacterized protein n=1 Tax=Botryotinia calthae TaxID=38488 RepID=A0A4Y8D0A8_9HELO|nr:hypothetical protein BOTCAL_0184g00210 [Botryotinia calthae]
MPRSSELFERTITTHDSIDRKSKRSNSWETKNAIVYDVSSQKLLKTKREAVKADHTRIKIPKRPLSPLSPLQKDEVRISMPLNSVAGSDIPTEVKLSSLG